MLHKCRETLLFSKLLHSRLGSQATWVLDPAHKLWQVQRLPSSIIILQCIHQLGPHLYRFPYLARSGSEIDPSWNIQLTGPAHNKLFVWSPELPRWDTLWTIHYCPQVLVHNTRQWQSQSLANLMQPIQAQGYWAESANLCLSHAAAILAEACPRIALMSRQGSCTIVPASTPAQLLSWLDS